MLHRATEMQGLRLQETDGDLGHLEQMFFDDLQWVVRYLVVDTGHWLPGRRVLISPIALGSPDLKRRVLPVNLTREQVENSPPIETHQPLSRRWEHSYYDYYSWPAYWIGASLWGAAAYPSVLASAMEEGEEIRPQVTEEEDRQANEDSHLQSTDEVAGYSIQAEDGDLGHVADFLIEDETWAIRYLVVDTGTWWHGKMVLLAPSWIDEVNWNERQVRVHLQREVIRNSPPFDPQVPISREYEVELFSYYGKYGYWQPQSASPSGNTNGS